MRGNGYSGVAFRFSEIPQGSQTDAPAELYVHLAAGPKPELLGSLAEKHGQPVNDGASGRLGLAQK
jgi:hypothetical protein